MEQHIARIGGGAHGIVTRAELLAEGVSRRQIDRRIAKGLLIPEYPGVYRAGHAARSREATYTAAVKACGPGDLLRGPAAGHLLGILKSPSPPPPEVLTETERRIPNLKTVRTRRIDQKDRTTYHGIPCTTVPRTLVDLAAHLADDDLARACHLAGVIYGVGPQQVEAVLERTPRTKGAARLRAVLSGDTRVLLSHLEEGFMATLIAARLPLPETNKKKGRRYVDCRWPGKRVTVELNGFRFHNSRHSWEQDNDRERAAYARGDAFRRYSYKDVFEDPARMLAELRELLR